MECESWLASFVDTCYIDLLAPRDVANLMKPLLARGKIRCFGSATFHDYKASIEKDGSLVRRFAPVSEAMKTGLKQSLTMLV